MSDSWNVPKRSNNCNISMLIEKMNVIFPLCHSIFFQPFPIFFPNDHSTAAENGTIIITFSMHSVVSCFSPFTVSQMPHPPITLDKGFIQMLRFNRVRNRMSEVTIKQEKQLPKKHTLFEFLIPGHYGTLPSFARMYWLIRIQVEKHGEERKKE